MDGGLGDGQRESMGLNRISSKMAACSPLPAVLLILFLSDCGVRILGAGVGINYGRVADNLLDPDHVVSLIRSLSISRVKLYDADAAVLRAFAGTGVEFIVEIGNGELSRVAASEDDAIAWVRQNVKPFLPQTRITTIAVGNEVLAGKDTSGIAPYLLPAMKSLYTALADLRLTGQLSVTTAHSMDVLGTSFPPSAGRFRPDIDPYIKPLLDFHAQIGSPFLVNAYPFFAYKASPQQASLAYALFQPNPGMTDPGSKLRYDNMLYAQIDAVYSAIRAAGHGGIEVRVSETGWPSAGDADEHGASPANAAVYNGNLMRRTQAQQSTPGHPSSPVDVHLFALFNEDLKPGPASERNYGLLHPNGTPVYALGQQPPGFLMEISASPARSEGSNHLLCLCAAVVFFLATAAATDGAPCEFSNR